MVLISTVGIQMSVYGEGLISGQSFKIFMICSSGVTSRFAYRIYEYGVMHAVACGQLCSVICHTCCLPIIMLFCTLLILLSQAIAFCCHPHPNLHVRFCYLFQVFRGLHRKVLICAINGLTFLSKGKWVRVRWGYRRFLQVWRICTC